MPGPLETPAALLDAAAAPPAISDARIAEARQRRSDIGATRARVEALRAFAEEPSKRFLPAVLLNAQTRNVNDGAIGNRNSEGLVGVTVAWPVFDAGIRGAEAAERSALVRGAELQLEAALREVAQQLRGGAVQLSTEQAALREATAALRAARKNADETSALYREGLASALELADANQRLFEAEVARATATYRMALAWLGLREAEGVGPVGEGR